LIPLAPVPRAGFFCAFIVFAESSSRRVAWFRRPFVGDIANFVTARSHGRNVTPATSRILAATGEGARSLRGLAMKYTGILNMNYPLALQSGVAVMALLAGLANSPAALADDDDADLRPGNLLLSKVIYDNNANNVVAGVTVLPPNCTGSSCVKATAGGTYPTVFNNALIDGSFGITSKIVIDQLTPFGQRIGSIEVPNSSQRGITANSDQMVGSFSSKSEVALNLSADKNFVTFMGYLAAVDTLDVSNSNTPFVVDPTNPVTTGYQQTAGYYRIVAQMDQHGRFHFTKTNAYSGNNGRAAILNNGGGKSLVYTSGNAGNGKNPQPPGVIVGAGAQILTASGLPLHSQIDPGLPTPVGSFNITELGDKADKIGKDDNFRGLTVFNNVIYYSKGSGGNGINTVYFVDTTGSNSSGNPLACPNGSGLPAAAATLPTTPIVYTAGLVPTKGVFPYNMCVLQGFPTALSSTTSFPFGVWFANATTLYIADEGNGSNAFSAGTFTDAAAQTTAGLQKWVFDSSAGAWKLAYVLAAGLDLGVPYTVQNYPTGNNPATNLPWPPATDGLRNLVGRVHHDGTVTIWAITSTVSGSGDQGADPNKLVAITDRLAATSLPSDESFKTLQTAQFAEVLRGVSFTPGTGRDDDDERHADNWGFDGGR
jgi:hypothetical protein